MKIQTRPWGDYQVLDEDSSYKVKRIRVKPGEILSLQSHEKRSEHWTIVSGTATVTLDDSEIELEPNKSIFIPVKSRHRIANNSDSIMIFIEVQVGDYFGEDDIIRYDDKYGRQ